MGMRIFKLSKQLLVGALKLSPGTEIVAVSEVIYFHQDAIAVKVEHSDFPSVGLGHAIPEVTPMISSRPSIPEDRIPVFVGWMDPPSWQSDTPVIVEGPL